MGSIPHHGCWVCVTGPSRGGRGVANQDHFSNGNSADCVMSRHELGGTCTSVFQGDPHQRFFASRERPCKVRYPCSGCLVFLHGT